MLIKDTCPIAAEILEGKHDENLSYILEAVAARRKMMFRKGAKVRLVGTKNPELEGKEGVVLKINPKRIGVGVGEISYEEWDTRREFPSWSGGEFNVPPQMLEVL
jgi:hypothetical protein